MIAREEIEGIGSVSVYQGRGCSDPIGEEAIEDLKSLALLGLSMQWQPIETAPDGRSDVKRVLVFIPDVSDALRIECVQPGAWLTWRQRPTHWMPLPEEPR